MVVDLIFLSRDLSPMRADVARGLEIQRGVEVRLHRVTGPARPGDPNRWATIARARNEGKRLGKSPWVMYLDDDVVLGTDCVARLVEGLSKRPGFAALGADCAGEMAAGSWNWDYPPHVGMASTLFRRERLACLEFRWEAGKCECRCCCDDIRRDGYGIGYLPGALAWHRPDASLRDHPASARVEGERSPGSCTGQSRAATTGRILAAFDRKHYDRFRRQFVPTLRASGNREPVTALAYGLHPGERARLEAAGVEVVGIPGNSTTPCIRRVRDFEDVVARWPEETPVAYWDAGDVLFQGRLAPLWELVRAHPDRLLLAREPVAIGQSPLVVNWTETIIDPVARRRAFELLSTNPYLNAGFAAGTARAFLRHLPGVRRLLHSDAIKGTRDWGDQTAMNVYCHANPDAWHEVPDEWNFCLAMRDPRTYRMRPDGRIERPGGDPVQVIHATGGTLAFWGRSFIE
ncbi:MAG: glycosyltransferase family 2 protein [Isosphaeraceae bacterium]